MAQALREQLAVVAVIPPRVFSTAAQTVFSDVVDMRLHNRALVIAQGHAGATKSDQGMKITIWNCDASGTAASTALKVGSALALPRTAGTDPISVIEVTAGDVRGSGYGNGLNEPRRYFKVGVTNGTNAKDSFSVVVLADQSRYGDAEDWDSANVKELTGV